MVFTPANGDNVTAAGPSDGSLCRGRGRCLRADIDDGTDKSFSAKLVKRQSADALHEAAARALAGRRLAPVCRGIASRKDSIAESGGRSPGQRGQDYGVVARVAVDSLKALNVSRVTVVAGQPVANVSAAVQMAARLGATKTVVVV